MATTDYLRLVPEPSVDDDWEQDFDVELTEEDLKTAEAIAKKIGTSEDVGVTRFPGISQ